MVDMPPILYRRSKREFAEAFLREGTAIFRSLAIYRGLESKVERVGDMREGSYVSEKNPGKVSIQGKDGQFIAPLVGKITLGINLQDPHNFFVLSTSSSLHPDQTAYGDTTIQINEPKEFLSRLKRCWSGVRHGQVEYYSPKDWSPEQGDVLEIWRSKRDIFKNDFEYRFCIRAQPLQENLGISTVNLIVDGDEGVLRMLAVMQALELRLGDLTDIAELLDP